MPGGTGGGTGGPGSFADPFRGWDFSSSQENQLTTAPWGPIQEPLLRGVRQAESQVLDRPLQYFPGQGFVPFAPETQTALAAQSGRAVAGSPLTPQAQGQLMGTLGGEYLGQGPGWDQITDAVTSAVMPAVDSQFQASNRFGSPLHAEAVARGTSRGLAPFLDAERNRMMEATAMAPALANQDYFDIGQLANVGLRQEDLYGRALADQQQRFYFDQDEPYQRISRYMNLINPSLAFRDAAGVNTYNPNAFLTGTGLVMQGAGTFGPLMMSSRAVKTENGAAPSVLDKLAQVPVETWRYHWGTQRHIGPYAEDFRDTFGVGDGQTIQYQDIIGVTLKAVQELAAEVKALRAELKEMKNA